MSEIFRVEKSNAYTVMSNYHLRDQSLSLKSKGLLSQILSLPPNWDYTIAGLVSINKESRDAIRTALVELEKAGYIIRYRDRDDLGRLRGTVYVIYEHPHQSTHEPEARLQQKSAPSSAVKSTPAKQREKGAKTDKEISYFPKSNYPVQEKPAEENPQQLNKDRINKEILNTESIVSYPLSSRVHTESRAQHEPQDAMGCDLETRIAYRFLIKENIGYDYLTAANPEYSAELDEIVELMTDTVCTGKQSVRISGENISADVVRSRLLKLTSEHVLYVLESVNKTQTSVRNVRQYMLACLYNAPTTMESCYGMQVRADFAGG